MAAAAVVIQQPAVVCQDLPSHWLDVEMNKHYVQLLQSLYCFSNQQIRDALMKLNEEGKRFTTENLLVALRHPGDPLVHTIMESGNYTYLDVMVFLEIFRRTNDEATPTVEQFHEHYRRLQGIGIAQLLRDAERNAWLYNRDYERFDERCKLLLRLYLESQESLTAVTQELQHKQTLLDNRTEELGSTERQLRQMQANNSILQNSLATTRGYYTAAQLERNDQQMRANTAEQLLLNVEQERRHNKRVVDRTIELLCESEDKNKELLDRAQATEEAMKEAEEKAKEAEEKAKEAEEKAKEAEEKAKEAEEKAKEAEEKAKEAEEKAKEAEEKAKEAVEEALKEAEEKAKEAEEKAKEAVEEAMKEAEEKAKEAEEKAKEAEEKAMREAEKKAKEAIKKAEEKSESIAAELEKMKALLALYGIST